MGDAGEERRLTTILAADVVGYSGLMAADDSGTLARLKAHRKEVIEPKTAEYRGRVVKLMGDGTLMEFGSVVDAVHFAVDVQRAMALRNTDVPEEQRITYRIGINIGDIIVEGEDIYGDGGAIQPSLPPSLRLLPPSPMFVPPRCRSLRPFAPRCPALHRLQAQTSGKERQKGPSFHE